MEEPPRDLQLKKRPRKRTSYVWKSFTRDEEVGTTRCNGCGQSYSGKTGTATLKNHAQICCRLAQPVFKQQDAEKALTDWVLGNNIPFSALDCPFFSRFMASLQPQFVPPGRTLLSESRVAEEYAHLRAQVRAEIAKISHFCLSFDGWSSVALRGYLGIVVQGINAMWEPKTYLLALKRVTQAETGEYVALLAREVGISPTK